MMGLSGLLLSVMSVASLVGRQRLVAQVHGLCL